MDYSRLSYLVPINKDASLQFSKGEQFSPARKMTNTKIDPIPFDKPYESELLNPDFIDFSGKKIGRLTVLGINRNKSKGTTRKNGQSWVCKCACGRYCIFKTKTLKRGPEINWMCEECNYTVSLREDPYWKTKGSD